MRRVGPHIQRSTPEALAWARSANVVKIAWDDGGSNLEAFHAAPDHAIRVLRVVWDVAEQEEILRTLDSGRVVRAILAALSGYRHPNLYAEVLNEIPKHLRDRYLEFLKAVVPALHGHGLLVAGPSWATGDWEQEDWEAFRAAGWCGLDAIALHAYWSSAGLTRWNALRYRDYWQPGDPPVLITECGRDRVRDGDQAVNEGYIPPGDGPFGWQAQGVMAPEFVAELEELDDELGADSYILGATAFTAGPNDEWKRKGFDCDPIAVACAAATSPWEPSWPIRGAVPVAPQAAIALEDWYPDAIRRPIDRNYTPGRAGRLIRLVVDHIADGLGSPYGWFNRDAGDAGSSAHFWISRDGRVEQYRPLSDTCWANGPKCQPDLSVRIIAEAVGTLVGMNSISVAIEHEGFPGQALTGPQIAASRKLHLWLSRTRSIPLDRQHVVGHYQVDACTRPNCPGPLHPWERILRGDDTMPVIDPTRIAELEVPVLGPLFRAQEWLARFARTDREREYARLIHFVVRDLKGEIP